MKSNSFRFKKIMISSDDEVVECGTSKCSFKIQKGSNHLSSFHQHDLSTICFRRKKIKEVIKG